MSQDTQDGGVHPNREEILALLQMADERMLHESGNPVYLRLKKELDLIRWVTWLISFGVRIYSSVRSVKSALRSENPDIESFPTTTRSTDSFPLRLKDIPILGVRIGPGGERLVYRAQCPCYRDEVCDNNSYGNCAKDVLYSVCCNQSYTVGDQQMPRRCRQDPSGHRSRHKVPQFKVA